MKHAGLCLICGSAPNEWCTEYHLPQAKNKLCQMRDDANNIELEIAAYEARVAEMKEGA